MLNQNYKFIQKFHLNYGQRILGHQKSALWLVISVPGHEVINPTRVHTATECAQITTDRQNWHGANQKLRYHVELEFHNPTAFELIHARSGGSRTIGTELEHTLTRASVHRQSLIHIYMRVGRQTRAEPRQKSAYQKKWTHPIFHAQPQSEDVTAESHPCHTPISRVNGTKFFWSAIIDQNSSKIS